MRIALFILLILAAAARLSGQQWQRLGPQGGMVLSLGVDAAGTSYLGTNDGHIFASVDRGGEWELRGRVGTRTDAVIAGLTADPRVPGKIFAAAWFREADAGGGVFRSDDAGRTWLPSGLQGQAVRALEFSASQPETMVAGTRSGVFRSRDAGENWERISPLDDPELRNVDSIAVDPAQPDTIYAGTYHLPWKTTDGGKTWNSIAAGLIDDSDVMSLLVDPSNPARVYLSACSGIYRSDNRGELWTKLQGIPYASRRTQAIVQDSADPRRLYAATTQGLWVTRDAGEIWERTTPGDWVVNAVAIFPPRGSAAARVLIGTDALGVLASEDSGRNFAIANRGFTHQVVKQFVGDARDPMHLLMLLERNGADFEESRDAGKTWSLLPVTPAPGTKSGAWSADRVERLYSSPWGWIASLTGGTFWKYAEERKIWLPWKAAAALPSIRNGKRNAAAISAGKAAAVPIGAPRFSAEHAYLPAARGVLRCDLAGTCALLSAFHRVSRPSVLWVSSDGKALAVASEGKFGISLDAGKSAIWRELPAGVHNANWFQADSRKPSELYLGTDRGLYFSGDAAENWMLVEKGLPAAPIRSGLRIGHSFLVTLEQGGIYFSPDGRGSWERIDQDPEHSRINGLVETQPGRVLFGLQSEGLLLWRESEGLR